MAGATITPAVVIAIQDAYGNLVGNAVNSVNLWALSALGGAPLALGAVKAVGGVATFAAVKLDEVRQLHREGQRRAAHLRRQRRLHHHPGRGQQSGRHRPADQHHGRQCPHPAVTVALLDAFGNPSSSATNTVTISALSALGGAPLALGAVKASSGVATFAALKLTKTGSYTLKAESSR